MLTLPSTYILEILKFEKRNIFLLVSNGVLHEHTRTSTSLRTHNNRLPLYEKVYIIE